MKRRPFIAASCALLASAASPWSRAAPMMRIVLGFPAGASGDAMARALAEKMSALLGVAVVVEDHPGADGRMALDQIRKARPDGTSLVFTPLSPMTSAPWLHKISYDPIRDFEPLVHVATFMHVLVVGPDVPARSLAEYAAMVRTRPELSFYSSSAAGSAGHMAMTAFALQTGLDLRYVPYKGSANAITDLLGGRLAGFMGNLGDVLALSKQGRVRPIGVASAVRAHRLPNVPTFREQGFDIEAGGGFAIYAPANLPPAIASRLVAAIRAALRDAAVSRLADKLGIELTGFGPRDLSRIQKAEYEQAGERIKASGFKLDE
jgi:tripartite-type tricarboxylate transporter receptor subunit TctC